MPPFRDDQLFIIAPGSQTTLAQLGLPESLTPARFHFRSCMFPGEEKGEYEPNRIRRKEQSAANGVRTEVNTQTQPTSQSQNNDAEYEEDIISEEGAVWPMKAGQVVDWPCFYALMTYIYNTINPPFHTPILVVAEPAWTPKEHERITQFFFERFKVPAFGIIDAAMATSYAYGLQTATVVDVGREKADVTAISDFLLHDTGRAISLPDCGGEAMTNRLLELLGPKGFSREMCEQLKKSSICEICAPTSGAIEAKDTTSQEAPKNPAAAASTGANNLGTGVEPAIHGADGIGETKDGVEDEGVLDVASIVTGGNMKAYLEHKEQEKAEKLAAKKKGDSAANAAKPVKQLANSKRPTNTFLYEDHALHNALKDKGASGQDLAAMQAAVNETASGADHTVNVSSNDSGAITREISVGSERFEAASCGIIKRLADSIYRVISAVEDSSKRSELWDSLVVVGNGSKLKGFREALLLELEKKYKISPSSATMFTSELPSNVSTPLATGMNTPQPQPFTPQTQAQPPQGSQVNPLLYAATTAQNPHLNPAQQGIPQMHHQAHSSHAQIPASIKFAKIPDYFPEWKDFGYEEAAFLGAQVAAKVFFTVDNGLNKGYMTRTDYNEQGPQGIHDCSL